MQNHCVCEEHLATAFRRKPQSINESNRKHAVYGVNPSLSKSTYLPTEQS